MANPISSEPLDPIERITAWFQGCGKALMTLPIQNLEGFDGDMERYLFESRGYSEHRNWLREERVRLPKLANDQARLAEQTHSAKRAMHLRMRNEYWDERRLTTDHLGRRAHTWRQCNANDRKKYHNEPCAPLPAIMDEYEQHRQRIERHVREEEHQTGGDADAQAVDRVELSQQAYSALHQKWQRHLDRIRPNFTPAPTGWPCNEGCQPLRGLLACRHTLRRHYEAIEMPLEFTLARERELWNPERYLFSPFGLWNLNESDGKCWACGMLVKDLIAEEEVKIARAAGVAYDPWMTDAN